MKRTLILIVLAGVLKAQPNAALPPAVPQISISANSARDVDVYSGWPMIVRATLMHSLRLAKFGNQPPLRIPPPGQSWADAIQLTAVNSAGRATTWPLSLVAEPDDPALMLANRSYAMTAWQMGGDATSALAPGTYRLTAALQVTGSDGWNGTVSSAPVTIRIGPEPSPLTPDQGEAKANVVAQFAVNTGDINTAASAIGGLLTAQPDNVNAMTANAALMEQAGLIGPAFFQASDAMTAFFQNNPSPQEMPMNLLTLYNRLFTEFLAPTPADNPAGASALVHPRGECTYPLPIYPTGAVPTPRIDAPIAYDAVCRQLLMFGAQDASGDRNDLWSYSVDQQQWTQVSPDGVAPGPRHGHTVTFDPVRRRIIVIAGQGIGFFGDAWAYDIQANLWTQLSGNSSGPSPRYGHSAIYDPKRDRIVLSHGFTSEQGRFDDTWAFDLPSNSWRDISPAGTRPLRRCLHHAVYVPQSDQMLLYGGCSSGFGPCPQGDLWSFDLANNQWKEITSNPRPAPRQRYGMTFDDNRNRLVLFGGVGGPPLNDTWEYDPASAAWTQVTPGGDPPTPRYRIEA